MTGNFSSNFNSAGAFAQNRKAHGTDPDHSCGRLREVETNARATPIKVGFVLLSNSRNPLPSTRIAGLNMFPFLRRANFDPQIVFDPVQDNPQPDVSGLASRLLSEGFRVVFFQKVRGPSVEGLVHRLSNAGVRTVYGVCDLVDVAMAAATDSTIVVTEYLKSLYPAALHSKIRVVHDGIEHPEISKTNWGEHCGSRSRPLRAVLVTSAPLDRLPVLGKPPEWLEVTIVGFYPPACQPLQQLRAIRWMWASQKDSRDRAAYLRFLTNRRIRRQAWDPVQVYDIMQQADIGIIPIQTSPEHQPGMLPPDWKVKSENRLTLKMSAALPVVATAIPAYEAVIEQGRNGFLARSQQDWIACLDALRDPGRRRAIGEEARESVLKRFSMQEQAQLLIETLNSLVRESA
jgi:glycosyltransferase involved in cell wall biosynthesis